MHIIGYSCKTPNHFLSFKGFFPFFLCLFAYRISEYTGYLDLKIQVKSCKLRNNWTFWTGSAALEVMSNWKRSHCCIFYSIKYLKKLFLNFQFYQLTIFFLDSVTCFICYACCLLTSWFQPYFDLRVNFKFITSLPAVLLVILLK